MLYVKHIIIEAYISAKIEDSATVLITELLGVIKCIFDCAKLKSISYIM